MKMLQLRFINNLGLSSNEKAVLEALLGLKMARNVSVIARTAKVPRMTAYDILKKFGMPEEIAYIAKAHHDDRPETLECVIVKIADAISGARPGARKDTYENYLQRLEDLEKVATSFDGIEKAYAIQAGREVRVFVAPQVVDDLAAVKLAKDIAHKIEDELKYPGEIKVNVIRESRVIEYAI
jgi:ribonuclease Y